MNKTLRTMQSKVNAKQYIIMYYSRIIIIIITITSLIIMYYSRPYWDSWLAALAVAVQLLLLLLFPVFFC